MVKKAANQLLSFLISTYFTGLWSEEEHAVPYPYAFLFFCLNDCVISLLTPGEIPLGLFPSHTHTLIPSFLSFQGSAIWGSKVWPVWRTIISEAFVNIKKEEHGEKLIFMFGYLGERESREKSRKSEKFRGWIYEREREKERKGKKRKRYTPLGWDKNGHESPEVISSQFLSVSSPVPSCQWFLVILSFHF